jgi:XTP/dITP diphosphohydrolase
VRHRLVLASANPGKLRELEAMLRPLDVALLSQAAFTVPPADEPHATFIENALTKARHAAAVTGLPCLADDSGVCVDALDGAPGVLSARFAGPGATDAQNNAELVRRLRDAASRRAHYTCVLVALRSPADPDPIVADARWHGTIVDLPRGTHGFGYDPHFWLEELGSTAAELEPRHKNRISHRGRALAQLVGKLREAWAW